ALVVRDGECIGRSHNAPLTTHDPSGHAEIRALREAGAYAANYRLPGSTLYVTIEPCAMCVGALVHARIDYVVFGAREPKAGALVSREVLAEKSWVNHQPQIVEGILADDATALMHRFFVRRRAERKARKQAGMPRGQQP
ncbi:MAG: nucleoside deaminase, partial [Natronospirillum sp.]